MIFKTFNNDIDKWTAKIGILGKTFNELGTAINNAFEATIDNLDNFDENVGLWSSLKDNLLPKKEDIEHQLIDVMPEINADNISDATEKIIDMATAVSQNKTTWQTLFDTLPKSEKHFAQLGRQMESQIITEEGVIAANQQARASALAQNEAIKAQTFSAKAGKIALQALATAGNMLLSWGISEAITLIYDCATASGRLKETASNLGSQFTSTKSEIEGYKTKITDLYNTINDSSSSYEDTYNARQELLAIQDEMIGKFGSEAEAVQLVTSAINGQTEALDSITKQKWQETVNEFINGSDKKWTERVGDSWANLWSGSTNNFDRMIKEMEDSEISFRAVPRYDYDGTYEEFSKKLQEVFGAKITHTERDDVFTLSGDLNDIYDQLLNIQSLANNLGIDNSFLPDLARQADEVKNTLESYQEIYSQHILYDKILDNNVYEQYFKEINDAYKKYQDEFASGNDEAIENAKQSFAEIVQGATDKIDDQSVIDYFNSMYPDLQEVVGGWEFEVRFNAAIDDSNDNFENQVKDAVSKFDASEDILNFRSETASQEQIDAYTELNSIADEYNLTLDQLIAKLEQLGHINSEADKAFQNSIRQIADDHGIADREQIAELTEFTKEFTAKQVELWLKATQGAENAKQAIEMYKAKLTEATGVTNEKDISILPTISSSVEQLATQLEPQFAKLGEAYQEIFKLDDNGKASFSLDAVDNSMLENLRKSFAEIEEDVGVAFDSSKLEPFFDALTSDYANSEDGAKQVQQAFNDLATAYLYSTDTLEQLNNETADAIEKQLEEMGVQNAAEICSQQFATLQLQKILCNENRLDSTKDINGLLMLAEAAGISGDAIAQLSGLKIAYNNAVANGDSIAASAINDQMQNLKTRIANEVANIGTNLQIDFGNVDSDTSKVGSVGKEAGDAYVDAFEEELSKLDNLRSDGVITEKEYLDRLRALYERYFKDKLGYEKEFAKYQRQYLEGYKSLYDSALSGISKLMDSKIDGYTQSKETAVESLEAEQEAAEAAYQAQIDAIQEQIDAIDDLIDEKNKQIDAIEDEIDKIKEASEARKRDIELQKAQYELERMQNQRTILQYSEEQGMHYVQDTTGVRDAREKVTEIQEDMQIAELEKQVSLIEKEIDLLNGQKEGLEAQQDALQKMMDESNKYYEKLISEQENYWDALIQSLEAQKSKWQELADIQEIAEAYAAVTQVFGELGYTVDDILNGNVQAFEDFRNKYIAIISDLNQNTAFQNGLEFASGINKESFGSIIADADDSMQQEMNQLGMDAGDGFIEGWEEKSGEVLESTKQTAMDAAKAFATGQDSNSPSEEYRSLAYDAIDGLLLGVEERKQTFLDLMETLAKEGSLAFMEGFNFEDEEESGILSKFEKLKSAVANVANAISGGGNTDNADDTSKSLSTSASGGLTKAIDQIKQTADNVLGSGGDGSDKEGSGVIGQFTQLKGAVDDVTASIGNGEDGSESDDKADAASLTGAITSLGTTTENILTGGKDGDESGGVIGRFDEFKNVIGEAKDHVTGISTGLSDIDGQEVECTIRVNIETIGDLPAAIGGAEAFGTSMNLESNEYKASYGNAGYQGTANVRGNWGTHKGGRTLVGELGPEMVVRGNRFFTVGNSGAEFVNLQKGDIVFNHKQTRELLKNGHITNRGNALAGGTANDLKPALADNDPIKIRQKLFDDYVSRMGGIMNVLIPSVNAIQKNTESMVNNSLNNISTGRFQPSINIGDVNVTCPGVTSQEVMEQVGAALNRNFAGLSLDALQQSMIRR